jgi:hypothetical protein
MSYALVNGTTIVTEGSLPASARRLDSGAWVLGLRDAQVELQRACGWFEVVDVSRPADTATHTYDRTLALVDGSPTVTWTQRAKTAAEVTAATEATNEVGILDKIRADMTKLAAIKAATNQTINQNPAAAIKDCVDAIRRLERLAVRDLSGQD